MGGGDCWALTGRVELPRCHFPIMRATGAAGTSLPTLSSVPEQCVDHPPGSRTRPARPACQPVLTLSGVEPLSVSTSTGSPARKLKYIYIYIYRGYWGLPCSTRICFEKTIVHSARPQIPSAFRIPPCMILWILQLNYDI